MEWFLDTVRRLENRQREDYSDMMTSFGVMRDQMGIIREQMGVIRDQMGLIGDQMDIIRDRLQDSALLQQAELTEAVRRGFAQFSDQMQALTARVTRLEASQ